MGQYYINQQWDYIFPRLEELKTYTSGLTLMYLTHYNNSNIHNKVDTKVVIMPDAQQQMNFQPNAVKDSFYNFYNFYANELELQDMTGEIADNLYEQIIAIGDKTISIPIVKGILSAYNLLTFKKEKLLMEKVMEYIGLTNLILHVYACRNNEECRKG